MSLVFLKNESNAVGGDNHQKPYDWTNHFASSMVLPPNSQVAFVSATMQRKENVEISAPNNVLYQQIGISALNKVMPIYLTEAIEPNWNSTILELIYNINNWGGQSDFMTDELTSPYVNGWSGAYSSLTDKITLKCKQRLQPSNFGVQFNPMRDPATGIGWSGINELGCNFRGSPNGITFWNAGVPNSIPVNPAIATSIGSANLINQGGEAIGTPDRYNDGSWSMWYSNTGIKRSLGALPFGGGWNNPNPVVGGSGVIGISLSPQAEDANARSEVPNCKFGVNSLQFIEGQEPAGAGLSGFVNNLDINSTPGGGGGSQSNTRYVLGCSIRQQILTIEIQNSSEVVPNTGGLPALGALGNSNLAQTYQIELNTWGATTGQPDPLEAAAQDRKMFFRFRWTTPYCMCVEGSTNFNQNTNIGDWFMLYDMATGDIPGGAGTATRMFVPSWYGDMALCCYSQNRNRFNAYGNFDVRRGYSGALGQFPDYELMMSKTGSYGGDPIVGSATRWFKIIKSVEMLPGQVPEVFSAAGYAEKQIFLVGNALINTPTSIDKFKKWKPAYVVQPRFTLGQPDTTLGVLMGMIAGGADGVFEVPPDVAGVYDEYGVIGIVGVSEDDIQQSIHIQLTDLPIQSRNGVSSQQVADIAVVHNWGDGGTSVGAKLVYQHYSNEKNWVDLNNIGEMTLNRLRVYCSYDNNQPAVGLIDKTDVLIMFRQKPSTDTSIPNQPIGRDYQSQNNMTRLM